MAIDIERLRALLAKSVNEQWPYRGTVEIPREVFEALPALLAAAARYYWLRNEAVNCDENAPVVVMADGMGHVDEYIMSGEMMDATIDAATARKEG